MQRVAMISLVAALGGFVPSMAHAQARVTFVPALSIGSIYDNNLFFRNIAAGDQMTQISPSFEASYETPSTTFLSVYSFDMERSFAHPGLNNLEARRHGMFEANWRRSEKAGFSLIGRYDRTEAAGELNFTTGLLLDRRRATRMQLNPSVTFQPNTRTTFTTLYDLTAENIENQSSAFEHIARFNFTRLMSPRGTVGLGYVGRHFINGDESQTLQIPFAPVALTRETHTSNAILFESTYQISPTVVFTMQAGPRLSSRKTLEPEVVLAVARHAINQVGYGFDIWRGESIILGVRGPVEVLSATSKVTWPLSQKMEIGLRAGVFNSTTLSLGQARVYHGEAVIAWSPIGPLILAASYGADFQRGDVRSSLLSDKEVVRHVIQIRLTAAPRLSRSFQPDDPLRPLGEPSKGVQR